MLTPLILDGRNLAKIVEESLKSRVRTYENKCGKVPVLATILVGADPASATYVKMKGNACARVGMKSVRIELPAQTTTEELLDQIRRLNDDSSINGILLQHPVPSQINERAAFDSIVPEKDVDGVTCLGFGRMSMGEAAHGCATPAGIMSIIDHYTIKLEGKHAVVIGRSPILGKPVAMMLLNRNATVTICHSRTKNLPEIVRQADIIVAAVGKPEFIQGSWIKEGAVIIDAGFHPEKVGDVNLNDAIPHCSAYTPVPGGVGPMTIATLIRQTMDSAEMSLQN